MTTPQTHEDMVERLMKEQLWTRPYAYKVVQEYFRFLFLAANHSVAPSFPIDQVWHTHMLFTRDYAKFCQSCFGKHIHHDPVGKGDKETRVDPYEYTKDLYFEIFGEVPPRDVWLPWTDTHYSYIDLNQNHVIKHGDKKTLFKLLIKEIFN